MVIGMPDAIDDLFVPLKMSVNRQGSLSIEQDDDMDMRDFDVEGDSLDEE